MPDTVTAIGVDAFADVNEKFILQCEFGSVAEAYARANKLKYQLIFLCLSRPGRGAFSL